MISAMRAKTMSRNKKKKTRVDGATLLARTTATATPDEEDRTMTTMTVVSHTATEVVQLRRWPAALRVGTKTTSMTATAPLSNVKIRYRRVTTEAEWGMRVIVVTKAEEEAEEEAEGGEKARRASAMRVRKRQRVAIAAEICVQEGNGTWAGVMMTIGTIGANASRPSGTSCGKPTWKRETY